MRKLAGVLFGMKVLNDQDVIELLNCAGNCKNYVAFKDLLEKISSNFCFKTELPTIIQDVFSTQNIVTLEKTIDLTLTMTQVRMTVHMTDITLLRTGLNQVGMIYYVADLVLIALI